MNHNTMSRRLYINITILVATVAGGLSLLQAAEIPPRPLYPDLTPACACEKMKRPRRAVRRARVGVMGRCDEREDMGAVGSAIVEGRAA